MGQRSAASGPDIWVRQGCFPGRKFRTCFVCYLGCPFLWETQGQSLPLLPIPLLSHFLLRSSMPFPFPSSPHLFCLRWLDTSSQVPKTLMGSSNCAFGDGPESKRYEKGKGTEKGTRGSTGICLCRTNITIYQEKEEEESFSLPPPRGTENCFLGFTSLFSCRLCLWKICK